MTERYSFTVDKHLVDGNVVWTQESIVNSTLTDTINEGYVTAAEDSSTRYLSVLDTTNEISLENLNITLSNPKLEVEDPVENYVVREVLDQPEEANDQVVVFSVEGSDELFGVQVVQDEEGNLQKYQFQFRRNEDGQLEAIPETITLIPMEEEVLEEEHEIEQEVHYANPTPDQRALHVFVEEDNSNEHILPDHHIEEDQENPEMEEETVVYENDEIDEETVDIKPGMLQLQNVKQEMQETVIEYDHPDMAELNEALPEEHAEDEEVPHTENIQDDVQEQQETNLMEYANEEAQPINSEENSVSSEIPSSEVNMQYQEAETEQLENVESTLNSQEFEHVEVNPDMHALQEDENTQLPNDNEELPTDNAVDSDENDYEIVEGMHVTGDVEAANANEEQIEKDPNILKHVLKSNKDSPKIVKKDNKLYLYVVQHPEKENVDSLTLEMSNLCRPAKVNPRSILKSSHAMFQAKNEIETNLSQEDRLNKRFSRCKEAVQAMLFHNFISKTTIPQAPVRKNRLPRKQKIKPVERMDEEIVVQEVMVSSNGFVEPCTGGVNKENLAVTEYVELTDSDDDYDPKKVNRKKKRHRRKRVEITISDESDASHDSVIELDETDDEAKEEPKNNNVTPPKRRRGRPPKNKSTESAEESPAKKTRVETMENPTKPEIPCPKCNKTFPSQNSLKTHLQHHNLQSSIKKALPEYKYKCDKCETTFINNILLRKHMCSKLFNCTICKKKFPDLSSLNGHKRTHAKEQMLKNTTAVQVSPKKPKAVQPTNTFKAPKAATLKCKTCGKLCSSMQNLNIHMKTHKEFICATCSKTFPSQLILEKHVRESCVKSPQTNRRSLRVKTADATNKRSPVRSKITSSPPKKSLPSTRLSMSLRVKCEECKCQFPSHHALFKHKVSKHGLQTPDKKVLEKERDSSNYGGVPAARKLQDAFAELRCELDFDD